MKRRGNQAKNRIMRRPSLLPMRRQSRVYIQSKQWCTLQFAVITKSLMGCLLLNWLKISQSLIINLRIFHLIWSKILTRFYQEKTNIAPSNIKTVVSKIIGLLNNALEKIRWLIQGPFHFPPRVCPSSHYIHSYSSKLRSNLYETWHTLVSCLP